MSEVGFVRSSRGVDGDDVKSPRYWDEKAPQEQWSKSLPSISIPGPMYEALQELAMSPEYEYGGKVAPVIREAIEEFINRYVDDGSRPTGTMSLYRRMRQVRDIWVEEILVGDFINMFNVMEQSIHRWTKTGHVEMLVVQFNKLMASVALLPVEWRVFITEKMRDSEILKEAFELVGEEGTETERELARVVHEVIHRQ